MSTMFRHASSRSVASAVAVLLSLLVVHGCTTQKNADEAGAAVGKSPTVAAASGAGTGDEAGAAGDGDAEYGASAGTVRDVIYFAFDQSNLDAAALAALRAQAAVLKSSPAMIRLEGHADERGTTEYNLALGQRRADVARSFFISQGIAAGRIVAVSYGEMKPADDGHGEVSWAKNRRVEIRVLR